MKTVLIAVLVLLTPPALAQEKEDPMETRTYNIEFFTKPIEDHPGRDLGLEVGSEGTAQPESEGACFLSAESLCALIKEIDQESWDHKDALLHSAYNVLTITNRRSVQERVSAYFAYLRDFFGRVITIDATFVLVDASLLASVRAKGSPNRPAFLSAEQHQEILAAVRKGDQARSVGLLRLTAYNGQRVSLQQATHHTYLRDFDVQIATASTSLDPVPGMFTCGTSLDVRAYLEPFGNAVTLEIRGTLAELLKLDTRDLKVTSYRGSGIPQQGADGKGTDVIPGSSSTSTTWSKLQHPQIRVDRIRSTVTIPEKETLLLGATQTEQGGLLLLLITPSVVRLSDAPVQEPTMVDDRYLRFYNVSSLTRDLYDFPGPSLDIPAAGSGAPLTGATFTLEEPVPMQVDSDTLSEMIRSRVAPESWENSRNGIAATSPGILAIRQKTAVHKSIDAFLTPLLASRSRMITTEAVLVGFRKGARAQWEKEIPALGAGGYFLEAEAFQKLLQESSKGGAVRILDRAEVTCFPQQRVHVGRILEQSYLADLEPQVSTLAEMHDPVVSTLNSGFVLDIRPHFISGTDTISLDLRASASQCELPEIPEVTTGSGYLQLPKVTGQKWSATLTCVKDRWTLAAIESRRDGDDEEERLLFIRARANEAK